jgi:alpha-ketoglutarate-dependent taurine dioxygenase
MPIHFHLAHQNEYQLWREEKLKHYPRSSDELIVPIENPAKLSAKERRQVTQCVQKANMAVMQCTNSFDIFDIRESTLLDLGKQMGLEKTDHHLCANAKAVSTISASAPTGVGEYIPYTNRPLSWHTDGYYNAAHEQVQAWLLWCAQTAASGGENALLDHEILYLLLRDENPDYLRALCAADAMTIPANVQDRQEIRPARSGPVFSINPASGALHMRYSARSKNILWKQDPLTKAALSFISALFSSDSTYIFHHRLKPGQCLISNNVLHMRRGFSDADNRKRVVYRVRYLDRIALPHGDDHRPTVNL